MSVFWLSIRNAGVAVLHARLCNIKPPGSHFFQLIGGKVDAGYIRSTADLATAKHENQFSWRMLKGDNPIMNFIILEHDNEDNNEVLFGWGRHSKGLPEGVFRSRDKKLVRESRLLTSVH
jgi:hypothetical protein